MRLTNNPVSPQNAAAVILSILIASAAAASAADLRIMTYNIDADTGGSVGQIGGSDAGPGLTAVLESLGAIKLGDGISQPVDVFAFEELNYNNPQVSSTLPYIVGQLNSYYGAGVYAYDTYVDPTDGNSTGNGPSGLIYDTQTVTVLSETSLAYSSIGAARAPMRYHLQPVGDSAAGLYLYISHAKQGTSSSDLTRQNIEAQELRADSATLGATANVIYVGDFNGPPTNPFWATLTASGVGQAFDPGDPANLNTESATSLNYRDDYQFSTAPVYSGTGTLRLVPGSYTVFGNNGSTGNTGNVTQSGNTALSTLGSNASTILHDLTTDTDHLPVVADYSFTPAASVSLVSALGATIITGGTGTLGATVVNSAAAGSANLDYTLSATVAGGSAALGSVTPSSGTLAPSASKTCTVAATSTLIGSSTIALTASDPNAANSPQTIDATLTVLDHAAGSAVVTAGDGFLVRAGATGLAATISVNNAAGPRCGLDIAAAPAIGSGSLSGGLPVPYLVSAGSTQTYSAAFSVGNTAGAFSDLVTFASAGDNQSLPGAGALGSLSASITGYVYSGNAAWTGTAAKWTSGSNWRDAGGGPTNPPGDDGVLGLDTAAFANSAAATAIDLTGADPNLQAISFSSSDYTLTNGSLTLQSSSGTAAVTVGSNRQTIAGSTILTLASPVDVVVAAGAELDINAKITEVGGSQSLWLDGGGTLVLSGTNLADGGTIVQEGTLIVNNSCGLADGSSLVVGNASHFAGVGPSSEELTAGSSAVPVPEPGTIALLAIAAALLGRRAIKPRPSPSRVRPCR